MGYGYGIKKSKKSMVALIPGIEESKYLEGNTLWYRIGNKQFWRLHDTDILTLENGIYTLNMNGFNTVTTRDRLNKYLPKTGNRVFTEKGIAYYGTWNGGKVPFKDGMKINSEGNTLTPLNELEKEGKEKLAILKRIDKYCQLARKTFKESGIPMPNNGDCWYCFMTVESPEKDKGLGLGEASKNHSHLESHIEEGYIFGSLVYRAIKARGYPNPGLIMEMGLADNAVRAIRHYLKASLGV